MLIREIEPGDVEELSRLYAGSVRAIGAPHYSSAQIEMWAGFADEPRFREFVLNPFGLVAAIDDELVGFGGVEDDGHVTSLYVHPGHMRKGVASTLLERLLAHADANGRKRLHAEASLFSQPVFEKFGFELTGVERAERGDVVFERYLVAREP